MHLINVKTFKLEEFLDYQTPPYAILSHTWGNDCEELTFRNVAKGEIDKPGVGSVKFRRCCRQAETDGFGYAWIDTCCINKDSSRELDEAINSMFRWYRRASACYAYLSDVPGNDNPRTQGSKFRTSRWFKRGWTLQELLAPKHVWFYSSEWHCLGTKAKLCGTVEKITGVSRQFLLGTAELRTASVAQRMSWAAHRDTKREEDLAYCLLGVFDVSMSMIYGEGGDKAFSRLQEEIMKTTRDHSILAWDLREKEPWPSDSVKATHGRILAATPSDFARSGHIVPREQSNASPNSLDISGGSLRAHLQLLTTSTGEIMGLLSCGPERDTQQLVGIPLTRMLSGSSDEYVRPRGCHSVLQPANASHASAKLIHIMIDSESKKSTEANQQHWSYDDDGFAEVNLDLVDVAPRSCWDEERALITLMIEPDGITRRTLARFRHGEEGSRDFVIVLEFKHQDTTLEPQCCVMTCCRRTPLEEVAGNLHHVAPKASGKGIASNGLLNLQVTVERVGQQPMSIIKPEAMPHPPDVTIDATVELQKLELMLEFRRILEEKGRDDAEEDELGQQAKEKSNRLDRIKIEREMVEGELRKCEEKRRALAEEERNEVQEIGRLRERQVGVKKRQERAFELWLSMRKQWDGLWHTDGSKDGHELERMGGQTPLWWAAENGHVEMVKLLLDEGADVASANKDGRTLLIAASSKGQADVVRLLLATGRVNADLKDSEFGRTPLSWAAANGREAVVQLLLDTDKADADAKDNNGRTPLQWAAEMGHGAVVQLLLEKRALKEGTILEQPLTKMVQGKEMEDVYIAVIGTAVDGKNLFIATCTGKPVQIRHNFKLREYPHPRRVLGRYFIVSNARGGTAGVEDVSFMFSPRLRVHLINMPEFNDPSRSDVQVLQDIVHWLGTSFIAGIRLSGIILIQSAWVGGMAGLIGHGFTMFKKLCGTEAFESAIIVTPMRSEVDAEGGRKRERALADTDEVWYIMHKQGSQDFRDGNIRDSARGIVNYILSLRKEITLDIQVEVVEQKREIENTSAAVELNTKFLRKRGTHQARLEEMRNNMDLAYEVYDNELGQSIQDDIDRLEEEWIENDVAEHHKLTQTLEEIHKRKVEGFIEQVKKGQDATTLLGIAQRLWQ